MNYSDKVTMVSFAPNHVSNPITKSAGSSNYRKEAMKLKDAKKTVITGRRVTKRKGDIKPMVQTVAPKRKVKAVAIDYKKLAMTNYHLDLSGFTKAKAKEMYEMRACL